MPRNRWIITAAVLAIIAVVLACAIQSKLSREHAYAEILKCIDQNNITQLKFLLQEGANPNVSRAYPTDTGPVVETPLRHAVGLSNREEIVTLLISSGAQVDDCSMIRACSHDNASVVSRLIQAGGNVNATNNYGDTALHLAAALGGNTIVDLLILKGARVSATDEEGFTPLHFAVRYSYPGVDRVRVVSRLLEAGADVNARTPHDGGLTPLWLAIYSGNMDAALFLKKKGGTLNVKNNTPQNYDKWQDIVSKLNKEEMK